MARRLKQLSPRAAGVLLSVIVTASAAVALAWVFFVPILEAPDETVHFEYSTALYSAGGLVAPRDAARLTVPSGRPVPYPKYMEDQSAVAVIAEKPDVKAPAGYGSASYYGSVDSGVHATETPAQLFDPPLLRYYPFAYYLLDAAFMGVASLFTASPVALFFAARSLSVALLVPSLLLTYLVLRRLDCSRALALALTAVVGLFPMSSMLASSVQSDNLSFTLAMLSLLAALELRRDPHRATWMGVLGLAFGALLVTKVHYAAIVGLAIGAMLVTQRLDARDARHWPRDVALLLTPAVVLESIQQWTQWAAPPLISAGQLGELPNYRAALAGGPSSVAAYVTHIVSFTFLDNTFGREFGSFWGVFGWVDTPLLLGSPAITTAVWLLQIAGMSDRAFRVHRGGAGQVTWRLVRLARRGRPRSARSASRSPTRSRSRTSCLRSSSSRSRAIRASRGGITSRSSPGCSGSR